MMQDTTPDTVYLCSSCGVRIETEFAEHQYHTANKTEGTLCKECAEWSMVNRYRQVFPEIRDALSEEHRKEWDAAPDWKKAAFAMQLHQQGQISVGNVEPRGEA